MLVTGWVFTGYPRLLSFPERVPSAYAGQQVYTAAGAGSPFVVPAGVTEITVKSWGAGGGGGGGGTVSIGGGGGGGGFSQATLSVTPGESLDVYVGGGGGPGAFSTGTGGALSGDGGGGAGHSTISRSGTSLIISGSGGGGGGGDNSSATAGGAGGPGGGTSGVAGSASGTAGGGGAGTSGAGGAGGTGGPNSGTAGSSLAGGAGADGRSAQGADGTKANGGIASGGAGGSGEEAGSGWAAGGGGGSGRFGGGGGSSSVTGNAGGGGGGGGSGLVTGTGTTLTAGSGSAVANSGDADYGGGAGVGGTGGAVSSSGTNGAAGRIVISWVDPVPTFQQSAYRWFSNANSTNVGSSLAALNTAATAPSQGTPFRLRMLLHVGTATLGISGQSFKLQYALRSGTCDTSFTGETFADISPSSGDIRYYDNATPADGAVLTANGSDPTHSTDTIVNQTYEESNSFTNSQASVPSGQDAKWDFALVDNSAPSTSTYCFRVVTGAGSLLNTYTVIPEVTTATPPPTTFTQNSFRWFANRDGITPSDPWTAAPAGSFGTTFGTGGDGSVTISTTQNINTAVLGSLRSTNADAITTQVTANFAGTSLAVSSTTGFTSGDEIMLINLRGTGADTQNAGNYEFLLVSAVPNGTTLTLASPVRNSYDGTSFASQRVMVQRVPQWTSVTINSGGTLTANDWPTVASIGGVIAFRATGTVTVNGGGAISTSGLGYRGGNGGGFGGSASGGINGESYDGLIGEGGGNGAAGTSGGGSGSNNNASGPGVRGGGGGGGAEPATDATNGGGGGAGGGYGGGGGGGGGSGDGGSVSAAGGSGGTTGVSGGGGGGAATNSTGGAGGNAGAVGGNNGNGNGGGTVGSGSTTGTGGDADMTDTDSGGSGGGGGGLYGSGVLGKLFLGSGGGGGGGANEATQNAPNGGDGGGIIYIAANAVTNSGSVTSNGTAGSAGGTDANPYGGSGGGAGGSINIVTGTFTNSGTFTATGGAGGALGSGTGTTGSGGGGGGVGRVVIAANSVTLGTITPTPTQDTVGTRGASDLDELVDINAQFAPPQPGELTRLRISLTVGAGSLSANGQAFKLQFAELPAGTFACSGAVSWTDVVASTSSAAEWILGSNAAVTHGSPADAMLLTGSTVAGVYSESVPTALNPYAAAVDDVLEYDFPLKSNSVDYGSKYCFRMVESSGTVLSSYTNYPAIITQPSPNNTDSLLRHGEFFSSQGQKQDSYWAEI